MQRLSTAFALSAGLLLAALWVAPQANAEGLEVHSPSDGVRYVTGGVGDGEQQALKEVAGDYDLQITLASERGAYLADVKLRIDNRAGEKVLEADAGPIFLADLPDGRYLLRVSAEGRQPERRRVTIGEEQQRIHFTLESSSP